MPWHVPTSYYDITCKVTPWRGLEGSLWEADFEEIVEKIAK
jgi:hypothetical protein